MGIAFCHQYEHLNGDHLKNIILNYFNDIFCLCNRPNSRIFIQDGDPSQNSAVARKALNRIGAKLFSIPPRTPDLNPIENAFHLVKRSLARVMDCSLTQIDFILLHPKGDFSLPVISHENNLTCMLTSKACDLNVT